MRQGHVVRNVAELVDRIPADPKLPDTLSIAELQMVLDHIDGDPYAIAWQLALTGLAAQSFARVDAPIPVRSQAAVSHWR
jgi:hypothetical protein